MFGFTNEQNSFIQDLYKLLLMRVKELNNCYKTNRMEVGVLLDIHTWEYWFIDGTKPCEVLMRDNLTALQKMETARKYQLMFMHNHPSTGTFSGEDLKTFCNHDSLYIMSVVGNDGSIHILCKDTNFDDEKVLLDYGILAMNYYKNGYTNNNGTLAVNTILKNASNYGLIYKKGRKKL